MGRRRTSIRHYLAMLLVAAFVPAAILAVVSMVSALDREYQVNWQRSEARTTFTIAAVDVQMDALLGTLDTLSANPALAQGDLTAFHSFARTITGERVDAVSLIRPDGVTVLNSRVPPGLAPPAFSVPEDAVTDAMQKKRMVVSNIFLGATSRRPIFAMLKPVTVAGEPHVLAVGLFAARFNPLIARTLPPWEAIIVDGNANDVAHFPTVSSLDGETRASLAQQIRDTGKGRIEVKATNGADLFLTFERSSVSNWAVITGLPRSDAEAPIINEAITYLLGAGILIIPTMGFAVWLGLRLVRSMRDLAQKTDSVAAMTPTTDNAPMACLELETINERLTQAAFDLSARETQLRQQRDLAQARAEETKRKSDELARSNTDLEQFAYVASHDLREPLRMVNSFLTLLERHMGGSMDGKAREFLAFARDGAARLDHMVLDLLDYSRVGRQGTPEDFLNLTEVILAAENLLSVALQDSQAKLDIIGPMPFITGRQDELIRLFQNLISNALKYRKPNVAPEIIIESHPMADGAAWISIRDNGIGIDPQYHARIFAIFQRLHDRGTYEGTGIGLSVCKKIVEGHGGRIWVDSAPGLGSTFHFTLREHTRTDDGETIAD